MHGWGAGPVTYKAIYLFQPKPAIKPLQTFTYSADLPRVSEIITRQDIIFRLFYLEN